MTIGVQLAARLGIPAAELPHLTEALTHRSYAAENRIDCDYQRLEFLGDAVLETLVSELLVRRYPAATEGEMSQIRAALVREESFAGIARHLRLGDFIRLGKGEREAGGAARDSVLADIFEAVIGAVFLDRGFEEARRIVVRLIDELYPDPAAVRGGVNPKGALQELTQGRWGEPPVYRLLDSRGPDHARIFEVEVRVRGVVATATAPGRRAAEIEAARKMLSYLKEENPRL